MITYKRLGIGDLEQAAALIHLLTEELGEVADMASVVQSLEMLLPLDTFVCYGAFDEEKMVGTIGVILQGQLFNFSSVVARESHWYVLPSYRGAVGMSLLDLVERACESCKIDFGISNLAIARLMHRRGYRPIKTIMRRGDGNV